MKHFQTTLEDIPQMKENTLTFITFIERAQAQQDEESFKYPFKQGDSVYAVWKNDISFIDVFVCSDDETIEFDSKGIILKGELKRIYLHRESTMFSQRLERDTAVI